MNTVVHLPAMYNDSSFWHPSGSWRVNVKKAI